MNGKIRRQKTEDRRQTSCLRRLKPTATHCSLLIVRCLLLVAHCSLLIANVVYANQAQELPYTVRNITDGGQVDFHPDFSPDGKKLVFASKSDIDKHDKEFWNISPYYVNLCLIDSDGNNRRQLTSGKVIDCYPSWTPDGEKVLFVSNRGGQWDIWSIKKDGSELTRLTDNQDKDYSPRATPDGKHILFFSTPTSSEAGYITESVWIMDMDGKDAKRLTSGGKGDWYPSMHPDGNEIIFASMRLIGGSLWTIDRDGKDYRRLTYGKVLEFFPNWSPDGTKIAYVSRREHASFDTVGDTEKDPLDIWIMDRDGSNKRQLTKNISGGIWDSRFNLRKPLDFISYYHLSWHPDGTKIALTTWEKDQKGSYISIIEFNKDTINKLPALNEDHLPQYTLLGERELTAGEWEDFGPSFSPDGNTIIFSSNRTGNWDIWSIGADGEGLKQLTKESPDEIASVFSPDGKEIAFLKSSKLKAQSSKELLSAFSFQPSAYDIWLMNSDGSEARQVTTGIKVISYPAWKSDGKEIAFVSKGDEGVVIGTYNIEQKNIKKIAAIWNEESESQRVNKKYYPFNGLFLYRIDYNSKDDKITFESNLSGNVEIWVMNSDGKDMNKVTRGNSPHWNPVWSPDGQMIAYATEKIASNLGPPFWPSSNYNIWLADVTTGKEEALTAEEQTDWNPVWSPNGKKIAYVTNRSGEFKHNSIWLLYLK